MHLIAQLPLGTDAIGIANQQHSQHRFRINVNCNSCWTQLPSSSIPFAPQMITNGISGSTKRNSRNGAIKTGMHLRQAG
jgi:hypothetical protein